MASKKNTSVSKTVNGKEYRYNYYRITKVVGYEYVDGEKVPVKKQFYGSSKSDAEKMYEAYKDEQLRAKYEGERLLSVASFAMRAREFNESVLSVSDKYAENTKKKYENCYKNHIKGSWLDKMVAKNITAADIQKFYNEADVTKSVLATMQKYMRALYKWMARSGYAHDVLSAVEIPKKPENKKKEEIVVWTDSEMDAIRSGLSGRRDKFFFLTLIYTGMRVSEALGLKYADIYDDVIHVRRQYNSGAIKDLKTGSSSRDIPLHPVLKEALGEHMQNYRNSEFVFTSVTGNLLNDGNIRREAARYYKKINVPNKALHAFRATFCTNLCRAGIPLEVASKMIGHKSVEVTAKYYRFVEQDAMRDAIYRLR